MATEGPIPRDWQDALRREDSALVMEFLAKDPSLLSVGLRNEGSQLQPDENTWKERTALHVGVRRGNAALVELILCKIDMLSIQRIEVQDSGHPRSTNSAGQAKLEENEEAKEDEGCTFLRRLLTAKDGKYNLDAIAIAAMHGNRKIFLLLLHAMGKCELYGVRMDLLPALDVTEEGVEDKGCRAKLKTTTQKVVEEFSSDDPNSVESGASFVEKFQKHVDFNFLPWDEYLFHFLFAGGSIIPKVKKEFARSLWKAIRDLKDETWRFVLKLLDGQGRTPLNVAYRTSSVFETVVANDDGEIEPDVVRCIQEAPDGAGRTALHRALATGDGGLVSRLITWFHNPSLVGVTSELPPLVQERWEHAIPKAVHTWTFSKKSDLVSCAKSLNLVSSANGFSGSSSNSEVKGTDRWKIPIPVAQSSLLHTAVIQKQASLVWKKENVSPPVPKRLAEEATKKLSAMLEKSNVGKLLHRQSCALWQAMTSRVPAGTQDDPAEAESPPLSLHEQSRIWTDWGLDVLFPWCWVQEDGTKKVVELDAVELAVLLGDVKAAKCLPLGAYNLDSKRNSSRTSKTRPWSALHIAANTANYEMLKMLLDAPFCAPNVKDWQGNIAVHHALNLVSIGKFKPHLLDYVNCKHLQSNDLRKETPDSAVSDFERRRCVNLLLQAGCDIFKSNKEGQSPYPKGKLTENSDFVSWWLDTQAKVFDSRQSTLTSAANAISVTATLVATASYVGPLQPPLGLAGDPSQIQDANLWVKVFIFCDTMSFYFAIVAITLSLIPSIPITDQKTKDSGKQTRLMVALSLTVLFPAIIFVLVAFISSSISVVSANVTATGGSLTIATASIGGLLCLLAFILFFLRLLVFIFPKSKLVRRIYNATNSVRQ